MASVGALLCDETESEDQGRQSRLFFPGGLGNLPGGLGNLPGELGNLPNALKTLSLTLFQQTVAPTTTATTAATTTTANNAQITALEEKAELLENNIKSLKEARAAVERAIADARRRKRAAATTCSGFISLVQKRKKFIILKLHGSKELEIFQSLSWILRAPRLFLLLMTLLNLKLPVLLKKR